MTTGLMWLFSDLEAGGIVRLGAHIFAQLVHCSCVESGAVENDNTTR